MTPLPNGAPSHDTFTRVFQRLPPSYIADAVDKERLELKKAVDGVTIHIDGKVFRGSGSGEGDEPCMVTVYDGDNDCSLSQRAAVNKKDEHAPTRQIISSDIYSNCLFTLDAGFCYKGIVMSLIASNNDYLIGIKGNQKKLLEEILKNFEIENKKAPDATTRNKGHGRIEVREIFKLDNLDFVRAYEGFTSIKGIYKVKSTRTEKGKTTEFYRYYITSRDMTAEEALLTIRKHWRIENNHHWVLDTQFDEDKCRSRKGNAAFNHSIVRIFAKNMLSIIKKNLTGVRKELGTRELRVLLASQQELVLEYLFA